MQLGGKPPKKSSNLFDNDFASGFEESKFDKFKPVLKVIVILIIIAGLVTGGVWAYSNSTTDEPSKVDGYSSSKATNEDDDPVVDQAQDESDQETTPVKDSSVTPGNSSQKPVTSQSGSTTPSGQSTYDPNKCNGLESEYKRLKSASEGNYTAFNNAMNSAKIWGDIYEEMGRNKALTDQAYNEQQAHIEALQEKWKDSLTDKNNAYDDFLKCRGSNN